MAITTISSREFNQDLSRAKRAAREGPVFITDRGRPAHVLITIETYRQLTGGAETIVDLLSCPGAEAVELEPPRAEGIFEPADLD